LEHMSLMSQMLLSLLWSSLASEQSVHLMPCHIHSVLSNRTCGFASPTKLHICTCTLVAWHRPC
jgi:hypothetical protein